MIGDTCSFDVDGNEEIFTNYFESGCAPSLEMLDGVVVDSIENKMMSHLDNEGLVSNHNIMRCLLDCRN